MSRLTNPLIALKHKNFRYYWLGMCISLIGSWMQNIAQPWLAYTLTDSPLLLGLIGAMQFTPVLLFSLFAGVLIDNFSKKSILIVTQSASLVITLFLAILVQTGQVQYWHILVAAVALGFVNAFDMPARQAFVIELVEKKDLMSAIALNSSAFNAARIIGPVIAGIILGTAGIALCFFINSFSFAAVIISLIFVKPNESQKAQTKKGMLFYEIKDGLKYIFKRKILWNTMLLVTILGTFAINFSVLVPVFAKVVLGQQGAGFSFLMSFMGAGSLLGALFVGSISRAGPNNLLMKIVAYAVGISLIITGFLNVFFLAGIFFGVIGFFFVTFAATANSILQLNTEDKYRGRVMSVYTLVFAGSTPIGNLYAGIIADRFGAGAGFIACGAITIFLLLVLALFSVKNRNSQAEQI